MKPRHSSRKSFQTKRRPRHEDIARLAYELYEKAGRPDGKHLDHWFNAEAIMEGNFGSGQSHTEHDFSQDIET